MWLLWVGCVGPAWHSYIKCYVEILGSGESLRQLWVQYLHLTKSLSGTEKTIYWCYSGILRLWHDHQQPTTILICMHFVAEPLFLSPVTNVDIAGRLTPQHNEISPQSCNLVLPVFDLIVLFLQLCSLMFTKCIANLIHNPVQSSAFAIIPFPS